MSPVQTRPMTEADVAQAAEVAAAAFEIDVNDPQARAGWEWRMRRLREGDPEGAFVTEHEGEVVGVAQALIRERLWILAMLTVSPTLQRTGGGDGRALVNAALGYDRGTEAGLIMASNDPKALRLYGSSGFTLHPTFEARGKVDANRIPALHPDITEVPPDQIQALAPISRAVRGAAHTQDFEIAFNRGATIFRLHDRGFVVAMPGRGVWALAALDEQAAAALLWRGLSHVKDDAETEVGFITGAQKWAIDVLLAARLPFQSHGAIAVRGNPGPLTPYIPTPPVA
jgi:predicted N-acetyltransferase YhbS